MTTARQEKPSVPTPDAGEVWAHHRDSALAKLSIPERAALTRRLAELEAGPLVAEVERLREEVDMLGNGLADMNEALLASEYCGDPSMRDSDERVEVTTDYFACPDTCRDTRNPDPTKQRMRDEQDALLAGYAARREAIEAGGSGDLSVEEWNSLGGVIANPPPAAAWLREAVASTPSPAAGAVALADGLAALLRAAVMRLDFARGLEENSRRLNSELFEVAWTLHDLLGDHEDDAAASTAPAVVRGDGVVVDFEAIGDAAFDLLPSDPEPGYFAAHVVGAIKEAIGEYHRQLEQRLAQLEAAAGKKAGA